MGSLEAFLDSRKLSVEQLAELSGVKARTIYRILRRKGDTAAEKMLRLARATGIPVETLIREYSPDLPLAAGGEA